MEWTLDQLADPRLATLLNPTVNIDTKFKEMYMTPSKWMRSSSISRRSDRETSLLEVKVYQLGRPYQQMLDPKAFAETSTKAKRKSKYGPAGGAPVSSPLSATAKV